MQPRNLVVELGVQLVQACSNRVDPLHLLLHSVQQLELLQHLLLKRSHDLDQVSGLRTRLKRSRRRLLLILPNADFLQRIVETIHNQLVDLTGKTSSMRSADGSHEALIPRCYVLAVDFSDGFGTRLREAEEEQGGGREGR